MYVCASEHTITINTLSIKINHYANTFYYNMHHTNRTVTNNNNNFYIISINNNTFVDIILQFH